MTYVSSHMPQPRSSYCPPGHSRCPLCNALVRDGAECGCQRPPEVPPALRPVREWVDEGVRAVLRDADAKDGKMSMENANGTADGARTSQRRIRTVTCRRCGSEFETNATNVKFCPGCRKKHHREAVRENWQRKHGAPKADVVSMMNARDGVVREIRCERCGGTFEFRGMGRPPRLCGATLNDCRRIVRNERQQQRNRVKRGWPVCPICGKAYRPVDGVTMTRCFECMKGSND